MDKIAGINLKYINRLSDAEIEKQKGKVEEYTNLINRVKSTTIIVEITTLIVCMAVFVLICFNSQNNKVFSLGIAMFLTTICVFLCSKFVACYLEGIRYKAFMEISTENDKLKTQIEIEELLTNLSNAENELVQLTTSAIRNDNGIEICVEWKYADAESGDVSIKEYKWIIENFVENKKVDSFTLDVCNLKLLIPVEIKSRE